MGRTPTPLSRSPKAPRVLVGICGIGLGHVYRQLPTIKHLLELQAELMIFAYGTSLKHLSTAFAGHPCVEIAEVAVPFYPGAADGLDFNAAIHHPANSGIDFIAINASALARAQRRIGTPHLVISDYEPVAAQYAYSVGAPLVTIDQQSKYLIRDDWPVLNGCSCADEIARLRMFFPRAERRLACSFFSIAQRETGVERIRIIAPTLRSEIVGADRFRHPDPRQIVLYLSSQQPFRQGISEIVEVLNKFPEHQFHIFAAKGIFPHSPGRLAENMRLYEHGDVSFDRVLLQCGGIVATAGHTLLSEAMSLGVPVYAMPLSIYEQQMNASVIESSGFGIAHQNLDAERLGFFLSRLPEFRSAIADDATVLVRGNGDAEIRKTLLEYLRRTA